MSQYGRRFSAPVRSAASQAASSAAASASSSSSSSAAPAAAAAFVHRDIFAHPAPDDITFQSPRKHGRRPSEQSFIPSKSKLERWNTKLGNYRESTTAQGITGGQQKSASLTASISLSLSLPPPPSLSAPRLARVSHGCS